MNCAWCHEPVMPGEQHPAFEEPMHFECGFRSVVGSMAHLLRRCSCYVAGSELGDPPGLSRREAAREALAVYRRIQRYGANGEPVH